MGFLVYMSIGQEERQVRHGLSMTPWTIPRQRNLCVRMGEQTLVGYTIFRIWKSDTDHITIKVLQNAGDVLCLCKVRA